jgi:uncharacterized protein (DUF2252 family)
MSDSLDSRHDRQNPANGSQDIWESIQAFDRDRDSKIVSQKYRKMRKNAFVFFRGTCHLFYRDLPVNLTIGPAPVVWICGDLHLENFGTYKGDDRQIYFGINDFDEGVLAPCTWDIARLLTSIFLVAESLSLDPADGENLARRYLQSYTNILSVGQMRSIVADNATGVVADLLKNLRRRKRSELLAERTETKNDRQRLKFDSEKILKIDKKQRKLVGEVINQWAYAQPDPNFFKVLDVGFRVAGTGSLGLDRYLILVEGKGSPDRNYLLDLKQQPNSSLEPYLTIAQPQWANSATRVMRIQSLVQSSPPALLAAIDFKDRSYLLRELQPTQDKIALKQGEIGYDRLAKLINTMAEVTAFIHLHGSGKLGSNHAQDSIAFSQNSDWQQEVLSYAINYARQVRVDYQYFCKATEYLSSI